MWCCWISPKDSQLPQFQGDLLRNLWVAFVLVLAQLQKENIKISWRYRLLGKIFVIRKTHRGE